MRVSTVSAVSVASSLAPNKVPGTKIKGFPWSLKAVLKVRLPKPAASAFPRDLLEMQVR